MSEVDEEKIKGVEQILKEPVFIGHDTNAKVVRVQLFFVSAVTLIYTSMGLKINTDSSILGLKFENLNDGHVQSILLFLLFYLAIHFLWLSWDAFFEWRLRITGTRTAFVTAAVLSDDNGDYPDDPRQSTLYNFYVKDMRNSLIDAKKSIDELISHDEPKDLTALSQQLEKIEEQLNHSRVITSLERFDNWFSYFCKSQNLRWIVIEFLLPLILALIAISNILFCN